MTRWMMLGLIVLTACQGTTGEECLSGSAWTGGNEESPLMNPGQPCIACHTDEGEGPSYSFAGTVYDGLAEPDDCNGVSGATVEVTDAEGTVFTATTNSAGNFFVEHGGVEVVFPVTAKVTAGDRTSQMLTAQASGDCNSCHGEVGTDGAPGRIYLP